MKKFFKITGISLLVILVLLFAAPFLFKDKIKAQIDKAIADNINANVYYDANSLSLSLFRHFPNISVSLSDFGIVNKEPFKGDTLAAIGHFKAVVDIGSVISGDKIEVKGIYLDELRAKIKVNKLGQANYDITKPDTTTAKPQAPTDTSALKLSIEKWVVSKANIIYDDRQGDMYAEVKNLNHEGSGDINASVYDLVTKTTIDELTYEMAGAEYLTKDKLDVDATLNIDMGKSVYTFKENTFKLNEFALHFDGSVAMPDTENINVDVKFAAPLTEFKNILSLIPSIFLKDFDKIKTDGKLAFDGYAKGTYNGNKSQLPAYGVNLLIEKGFFQYPDLPQPVKNINVDLKVENKDGTDENLLVNLKKGHLEMGNNPVDAQFIIQGLGKMNVDANVLAKINLEEVTKIFPIEGTTLKGLFNLDVKAKGVYDSLSKQMPAITANMGLSNGYAKTKDFASALEAINMATTVNNATGQLADTKVNVQNLKFEMDGQPFELHMLFENFDDYTWDLTAQGQIDLTKITKIFPLDDMQLAGIIDVDHFTTKGKMSLLDAGKYDQMPTSGAMRFTNFVYTSKDLPQGFKINEGAMSFNPQTLKIEKLVGSVGKSDIDVTGEVSNYISYTFGSGTVKGKMNFNSKKFDVNEWMAEDPNAPAPKPEEEVPLQVIEVPKNIDFVLASKIDEVLYSNYDITNLAGNIIVKDGVVRMDKIGFNMIGGQFLTSGTYDTKDIKDPKFDFDMDVKDVAFPKAYATFNTIKAFAPAAQNIEGNFSTSVKLGGKLKSDMMPALETLNGDGLLTTSNSKFKGSSVTAKLAEVSKLSDVKEIPLNDIKMFFEIRDGRVNLKKPLDFMAGSNKFTLTGSQGIDGSLDYLMKTQLPLGAISKFLPGITALSGGKDKMDVAFKVTGSGTSPKIVPVAGDGKSLDAYAKEQAKAALDAKKKQAEDSLRNLANKAKADAEAKLRAHQDSLKKVADAKIKAEQERLKKEAEDKLKNKAKDKLKDIKF